MLLSLMIVAAATLAWMVGLYALDRNWRHKQSGHVVVLMIVAGGLMMGRRVSREDAVLKGTNALFHLPTGRRLVQPEEPPTPWGSRTYACPLKLHPIGMADRIRRGKRSRALEAQLEECFLCGACSAVCPSDIPLVQTFHRGKQWRRE